MFLILNFVEGIEHTWHFENRGTIYSYFDFSLKQQFSVALPTP